MTTDPLLDPLDRLARAEEVSAQLGDIMRRVSAKLLAGREVMAWDTVPLPLFGRSLPASIASCWIFVIRPGADTGAERHPNSHQRSLSLAGEGEFHLRPARVWDRYPLRSGWSGPLERRWVSIPPSTWHRLFVGSEPWGLLSFHTVPAQELIEERPMDPDGLDDGPTERQRYADRH